MSRVNNSYYAIIGILGFGPMSGYNIKTWVKKGVGYFWDIDYKQIYPTLKKLVNEGLATFEIVKSGKRPESKVYVLTDKGKEELRNWLTKPIIEGKNSENELMLKLFFGHHVSVAISLGHLERFKESISKSIQELEEIKKCLADEDKGDSWHYRMAIVMKGEIMSKANIDWCNKTIAFLTESIGNKNNC